MKKAIVLSVLGLLTILHVQAQGPPGPPILSSVTHYGTHADSHIQTVCQASPYFNDAIEWTVYYTLPEETEIVSAYLLYDFNSGTQVMEDLLYMIENAMDEFIGAETFLAPQMEEWNTLWFVFEYADGTWEADVYSISWPYVW